MNVLNTKAGAYAAAIAVGAIAVWWLAGRAAAAVTTRTPNLYDPEKTDRLVFGFVNVDEPFALSRRVWEGILDILPGVDSTAEARERKRAAAAQGTPDNPITNTPPLPEPTAPASDQLDWY